MNKLFTFTLLHMIFVFEYPLVAQELDSLAADSTKGAHDRGLHELNYVFEDAKYFDPKQMRAPVYLQLYDTRKQQYWSPPLVNTRIKTSNFGLRWGKFHHGVDLALRLGAKVFAAFDGVIKIATYESGYGNYVVIKHDNGLETLYAHLYKRKVQAGQRIKAGEVLGWGGSTGYSTGPHLHFEVRYKGYSINPLLVYDFSKKNQIRSDKFFLKPHHFRHFGNATQKRAYLYHEVGQNETLEMISQRYEVSTQHLVQINLLQKPHLQAGQIIRIY